LITSLLLEEFNLKKQTSSVNSMMRSISVIGGSESDENVLQLAEAVGEEIAKRGAAVVCGGLGGVMEAACRGAKRHGGTTIGILPTDFKEHANKYVDIAVPTGMGYARNFLVAKTGDAVIAIAGSAGTLSEMAIAWFSDRPIIALVPSGGWAKRLAGTKIDERRDDVVLPAESPHDAVEKAFIALGWD
jgi:uncharacterized protein (TIGR00725 family)